MTNNDQTPAVLVYHAAKPDSRLLKLHNRYGNTLAMFLLKWHGHFLWVSPVSTRTPVQPPVWRYLYIKVPLVCIYIYIYIYSDSQTILPSYRCIRKAQQKDTGVPASTPVAHGTQRLLYIGRFRTTGPSLACSKPRKVWITSQKGTVSGVLYSVVDTTNQEEGGGCELRGRASNTRTHTVDETKERNTQTARSDEPQMPIDTNRERSVKQTLEAPMFCTLVYCYSPCDRSTDGAQSGKENK